MLPASADSRMMKSRKREMKNLKKSVMINKTPPSELLKEEISLSREEMLLPNSSKRLVFL